MSFFSKLKDSEQRPFFSHVFNLGGGTAIGQLVVILTTPIITRMYTPAEMGIFSLLVAFVGFVSVGTGLRYELAIVSSHDDKEAAFLTWVSFLTSVPAAILCGLVLLGMIRFNILSYSGLPLWSAPIVGLLLIFTQLFMSLRYWYVRQMNFSTIAKSMISQGFGRALVPLAAGLMGVGWVGLLMGEVAGRVLGIYRMLLAALPSLISIIRQSSWGDFTYTLKKYRKYPCVVLPSSLIDALASTLPLPVVSYLFGVEKAGLFFLVMRFATLPAAFISASIADVFHARVSEDYRNNPELLRPFLISTASKLFKIGLIVYVPLAAISPFLFGTIFGEKWAMAGIVMSITAPLALFSLVVSPVSRLLLVVDRTEIKLLADFICLVFPLLGLTITHHYNGNFLFSMAIFSFMHIIANIFYFFIIWFSSKYMKVQIT